MFGLGSPLAAPSLTEPARVRSQEREKETKRARWPREGRSRDESWAATATLAAARGKRTRGQDAKRCEPGGGDAPTKGARRLQPPQGRAPLRSRRRRRPVAGRLRPPLPPSPDPSHAPARPRSHTHRARATTARPPAALSRSPPRPPRLASGLGPGGRGRGGATSRARALSARRQRLELIVTCAAWWCPWRRSRAWAARRQDHGS